MYSITAQASFTMNYETVQKFCHAIQPQYHFQKVSYAFLKAHNASEMQRLLSMIFLHQRPFKLWKKVKNKMTE